MSLGSRGARYQILISVGLMVVIPILGVIFIATGLIMPGFYSTTSTVLTAALILLLAANGYWMLRKYAENIVRIRHYLKDITAGDLPDHVALLDSNDDLHAIEKYLNMVLAELKSKIAKLEEQLELARQMQAVIQSQEHQLLKAEQHRVMIQSLGAACHHIGQPATVIRTALEMLKKEVSSRVAIDNIDQCITAMDNIADILDRLRNVSEYRTVPYQTYENDDGSRDKTEILDIGRE